MAVLMTVHLGTMFVSNQLDTQLSFMYLVYIYIYIYTGCPGRKGQNFGRVFLMLKYTDITQNTYIQS